MEDLLYDFVYKELDKLKKHVGSDASNQYRAGRKDCLEELLEIIENYCPECGKSRNDLGVVAEKTQTKYEPWEVV